MPEEVPYNSIEMRVVKNWSRLVKETAKDRKDDLSIVQPFRTHEQTYFEVMNEVRNNTHRGLEFYRNMVQQLPWYVFKDQ